MRALFTCFPVASHFLPMTPFAHALRDAGHEVAFTTPLLLRDVVERAGFDWLQSGIENDEPEMASVRSRLRELTGLEALEFAMAEVFTGIRPRRLVPDLLAIAEIWCPDVFVRDTMEFGAMVAGELLDIPDARIVLNAVGARPKVTAMLTEPVQRLRANFGLPGRPIPDLINQYLVLVPFPPSLNTLGAPMAPTMHHVRALPHDDRVGLPSWIDAIGTRPLIYVSLGTTWSGLHGAELFSKLLAGLRDIDAEIVLTIGRDLDPATLGPQPTNVHVEEYLPLGSLLPRCSLALFHGGSGTLSYVVAHGLPMAILPFTADQPENAARCAELGVSRTLDHANLTPEQIREVVLDVLHTPSYRQSAERLRDEFNALPGPEYAAQLVERLARDRKPILTPPLTRRISAAC